MRDRPLPSLISGVQLVPCERLFEIDGIGFVRIMLLDLLGRRLGMVESTWFAAKRGILLQYGGINPLLFVYFFVPDGCSGECSVIFVFQIP